jgi:sulfite exporter TauE/SafE
MGRSGAVRGDPAFVVLCPAVVAVGAILIAQAWLRAFVPVAAAAMLMAMGFAAAAYGVRRHPG